MKHNHSARNELKIPAVRWATYAAAGAATALGGVGSAEAEIHYSGPIAIHFHTQPAQATTLDLSDGAVLIFQRGAHGGSYVSDFMGIKAAVSNEVRGRSFWSLSRLGRNEEVSNGEFYNPVFDVVEMVSIYGSGNFLRRGEGIIGFKFNTGRGTQYGWVRVTMSGTRQKFFTVEDYAWADPGESILTGQKRSTAAQAAPVPASGSLGLLAVGGAGLQAWRQRRSPAAFGQ